MENGHITQAAALEIIHLRDKEGKPFPFDMEYRTFNSQSKKGGKLIRYAGAKLLPDKNPNAEPGKYLAAVLAPEKPVRKPNHFDNRTRNIELVTGEIKTIRIDFIDTINGKKMIY